MVPGYGHEARPLTNAEKHKKKLKLVACLGALRMTLMKRK